jgi:hypothetical protein
MVNQPLFDQWEVEWKSDLIVPLDNRVVPRRDKNELEDCNSPFCDGRILEGISK